MARGGRFDGERGGALLISELQKQHILAGLEGAPALVASAGDLINTRNGSPIIEQGEATSEVYFVIQGSLGIFVNSKRVATRGPGDTVGEMSAMSPVQRRSATVVPDEDGLVVRLTEAAFGEIAEQFTGIWKRLAQELARRLTQRNALIRPAHESIRLFVISSAEALPVARAIENAFQHDPFITVVWANGVFKVSNYTLDSLEAELDKSDFAVAVAHPDDVTTSRDEDWPAPRDNVIFELGYFMGRLGRDRSILMEPRGQKMKLPSDLAGITTIKYRRGPTSELAHLVAPACNELREHILLLGRNI